MSANTNNRKDKDLVWLCPVTSMRDETSFFILLHIINTTSVTTHRQKNHQVFLFLKFFLHDVKFDVNQNEVIKVIKHISSEHVRAHLEIG